MATAAALPLISNIISGENGAFSFLNNLTMNSREKTAALYAIELEKLRSNNALSESQKEAQLLIIKQAFEREQAQFKAAERMDTIKIISIAGLFALVIILVVQLSKPLN